MFKGLVTGRKKIVYLVISNPFIHRPANIGFIYLN